MVAQKWFRRGAGLRGFTLVELLVVISIIALLMSILMPALQKAKELANNTVCRSQLKQIVEGARLWSLEHQDYVVGKHWWVPEAHSGKHGSVVSLYPYTHCEYYRWNWWDGMTDEEKDYAAMRQTGLYQCPSMTESKFASFPGAVEARDLYETDDDKHLGLRGVDKTMMTYGVTKAIVWADDDKQCPGKHIPDRGRGSSLTKAEQDALPVPGAGACKLRTIEHPSNIVYFMDHVAPVIWRIFIYKEEFGKDAIGEYEGIMGKGQIWRWHKDKTSCNIAWVDGHVSEMPDDFLDRLSIYIHGRGEVIPAEEDEEEPPDPW